MCPLLNNALEDADLIKDKRPAEGAQHRFAVHLFLAPGAEGLEHLGGGIREQPEGEFVLGAEAGVGLGRVFAHPHHIIPGLRQN